MFRTFLPHLNNISIGAFCGACLGVCFMLLIESPLSENYVKYGTYGIGALVALLGSGLALAGVLASIENQNQNIRSEKTASNKAAKAVLPLALSRLSEIANKASEISLSDDDFFDDPANVEIVKRELEIGDATIGTLKECIEFSDPMTQEWISLALAHYQVARSRLVASIAVDGFLVTNETRADHVFDWELTRAIVEHLFEYARGSKDRPPETLEPANIGISIHSKHNGTARYLAAAERINYRRPPAEQCSVVDLALN